MFPNRLPMAENNMQNDLGSVTDDRPLAVRRKRRISTALADPVPEITIQKTEDNVEEPIQSAKTPTKLKKRVRFSDPGPEVSSSMPSTGLTPFVKRTCLIPKLRGASPSAPLFNFEASRRLSLPSKLITSLPSWSSTPSPTALSGEVQFQPLRQFLDPRVKRRLRRNNLSEEYNDIEEERKSNTKWEKEVQDLKSKLAVAQESATKEHSESRQESEALKKVQKLEQSMAELRREMREQSMTVEPQEAILTPHNQETPGIEIYVDNDDDIVTSNVEEAENLSPARPAPEQSMVNEAATQASFPSPTHAEMLREARLSLEHLFPGEIALGFILEDPKPLFDVMLQRLQNLKAEVMVAEDSLSTTQTSESNMRFQFNAVLEQLERARNYAQSISKQNNNDKARADTSQARVGVLENTVQAAAKKVQSMEQEANEKDRSIQKLQDSLGTYRAEVAKLESMITKMDSEQSAAISGVRAEMDEAVADLECHVVAETRGRREAEQGVEQRDAVIKELKVREHDLQNALHEKQQVLRKVERIFEEERIGREREVGGLNAQLGHMSSDLSEANTKLADAEEKQNLLMKKLEEERDAGLRAVESVQAELAKCVENAEEIKTTHVNDVRTRGAEVTQHQGLLTPISATRFKDVEGYVEVRRGKGKKKRDSGIVILEEDEDTIMNDI